MSELRKIPNVGKRTEEDLIAMGYATIASLRGIPAQRLYEEECALLNGDICGNICGGHNRPHKSAFFSGFRRK